MIWGCWIQIGLDLGLESILFARLDFEVLILKIGKTNFPVSRYSLYTVHVPELGPAEELGPKPDSN